MPRRDGSRPPRTPHNISRLRFTLAFAALVLVGAWARLRGFPSVLTGDGVELLPADSHYYVRFALLQLDSFPRFALFDPLVNHPTGATITWPPGHALLVALAVLIGGRGDPELGAAFVGPVVGTAWLLAVGLLAVQTTARRRAQGAEHAGARSAGPAAASTALWIVGLLALLPVVVESAAIGNADHHVHEPMLLASLVLLFGRLVARPTTGHALAAGALLGAGRLFTLTAFAYVPLMAAGLLLAALLSPDRERRDAMARATLVAGITCASLLGASVLLWGVNAFFYEQLSWFHPLFAASTFLGAAGIAAVSSRRWAHGGALVASGLAALSPLRSDLLRAGGHLGRHDPLLARVVESVPLSRDPAWAFQLFGIGLPLLVLALGLAAIEVGRRRNLTLLPALVAAALTTIAAASQARFAQSLGGALAVLVGMTLASRWGAFRSFTAQGERWRWSTYGVLVMGALSLFPSPRPEAPREPDAEVALVRPMLRWMRDHTPAPPEASGVVADYLLGHHITLWAERPAVATTFSQSPTHVAGNARASAVLAAPDDAAGWERMQDTGGRFLLLAPLPVLGVEPEASRNGLAAWLHRTAGMEGAGQEASAHFRLWRDAPERTDDGAVYARLFEAVPGAVLTGDAPPGTEVVARLRLTTNLGERLEYARRATADADGRFELRVAYATVAVHPVAASDGAYEIAIGERTITALVPEGAVYGATVEACAD